MSHYSLSTGDIEDIRVLLEMKGPMHVRDIRQYLSGQAQRALTPHELGSRMGTAKIGHSHAFERVGPAIWATRALD